MILILPAGAGDQCIRIADRIVNGLNTRVLAKQIAWPASKADTRNNASVTEAAADHGNGLKAAELVATLLGFGSGEELLPGPRAAG